MTIEQLAEAISSHDRFILTAHETPDADAIASETALAAALRSLGKTVLIINADPTPESIRFLDPDRDVLVAGAGDPLPDDLETFGLLMLDVADPENIGSISSSVLPLVAFVHAIDHHDGNSDPITSNYVRVDASSTCEILYGLIRRLGIDLDGDLASVLYTGICYDTGCFAYPKTTELTFAVAQELVALGVQPYDIYTRLYESNTVSALLLQSRVLSTLELHCNHAIAVQTLSRSMLDETGARYDEAQRLINVPLTASNVRVSVFFKENLDGLLRCSLRSKGEIDVAEIARAFHGGGHKTAAGFKLLSSLDETRREVLQTLESHFVSEVG